MEKGKNLKKGVKPPKEIIKRPRRIITISAITLLAIGLCLMPSSVFLTNMIQSEIDKGVADEVKVPHPHNPEYDEWVSNDYDDAPKMYSTFYMWNLTNPDEFLAGNKPIYEEVGPFDFNEIKHKYDIEFSDDKEEVSFKEYSTYIQDEDAINDISQVKITNVNPGFLGGVATAGGTDLQYNHLNFPFVLSQLREQFYEMYSETIENTLSNHTWIQETLIEMLKECDNLIYLLLPEEIYELMLDSLTGDVLETFLRESMPTAEEVFYAEWANDYFPEVHGNYQYLIDNVEYRPYNLLESSIEDLNREILADHEIQNAMDEATRKISADLVDASGSLTGEGVDIDGLYGYTKGSKADLNISTTYVNEGSGLSKVYNALGILPAVRMDLATYNIEGGSNLNFAQCQALWDKNNPNSLTGIDYETNKVWFKAANGDTNSKTFLKGEFQINDLQLDYILKWINVSTTTWEPNVVKYTLNSWNSGVITTRTVEEWLFTAEDAAIYTYMNYSGKDINRAKVNIFDNCQNSTEADEAGIKSCKIKTGRDDISKVGQYIEYDDQDTIDLWAEPEEIEGTNGMQFAPNVNRDEKLKTFQADLMRVVDLEYKRDAEIYGIELYRFKMDGETFEKNPIYYMDTQGLINLQPIEKYQGIEVRVSKPHFLDTDPSVQSEIIGMEPDSGDHDTYIDIEPITGLVMDAKKRIQINFELTTSKFYYENITNVVIPIVWFEQGGRITKELAEEFKDLVYGAEELKETLPLMVLGIGAALFTTGSLVTNRQYNKARNFKRRTLPEDKINKALKVDNSNISENPLNSADSTNLENENISNNTAGEIPKSTIEDIPRSDTE